jgi:RHS repeat-associated protein
LSNGAANFLTGALGSTVALTDSGGNTIAQYTYEPFGNTTISGTSTNPYQYAGREDDGTGVYFFRARYYNPILSRFMSQDPIGFAEGPNAYAYVGDSPLDYSDPFGLSSRGNDRQGGGSGGPGNSNGNKSNNNPPDNNPPPRLCGDPEQDRRDAFSVLLGSLCWAHKDPNLCAVSFDLFCLG